MTAQPDNAALIAEAREMANRHRKALREEGQYGTTLLWSAKRENSIALLDALAAALAAAEEELNTLLPGKVGPIALRYGWMPKREADDLRAQVAAAEERAQAAEQSNVELTALGIDRELALEDSRAQVRELREALKDLANEGSTRITLWTRDYARAVLARSAGRAET